MLKVQIRRDAGQVLVQVALMVGVLFAFLALALDGGHFYAERRKMQNAADAGALAGARLICFSEIPPTDEEVRAEAEEYAIARNGAQSATVDIQDVLTVSVVASETKNTFFARVIGVGTMDVQARAVAVCGGADSAGGTFPLAFKHRIYTEVITCGQSFLVFSSKESEDLDWAEEEDQCVEPGDPLTATAKEGSEDKCNGTILGPHVRTADRGWLQMFDPGEAYPDDCQANPNCGASELQCWIRNDHPGPVSIGDCIPAESGVIAAAKDDVESRIDETLRIILYDRACDYSGTSNDPEPLGECNGTPYHVAGFGCVQIDAWEQNVNVPSCGDPDQPCQNGRNLKAVRVTKVCTDTCATTSGTSSGELPEDFELRAVSLVE